MAILFAGSELEAFDLLGTVNTVTTVGKFDSAMQRSAFVAGVNPLTSAARALHATVNEYWAHFEINKVNTGTGLSDAVVGYDAANKGLWRLRMSSTNMSFQVWWAGQWRTSSGTVSVALPTGANTIDVHIVGGASGSVYVYVDDLIAINLPTLSYPTTELINMAYVAFASWFDSATESNRTHYSEIIIADEDTRGMRVLTKPPTSDGALTTWTGGFADIDEIGVNDADSIVGVTNGDRSTFKADARTYSGALTVKAIALSARASRAASGPANLRHQLRKGGVNYDAATAIALGTALIGRASIWALDPSTGLAWTDTAAKDAALEFGFKVET